MRKLIALTVAALAVTMGGHGSTTAKAENASIRCPGLVKGIHFYRYATWSKQDVIGVRRHRAAAWRFHSCRYAGWVAKLWQRRAHQFRSLLENPPHKRQWWCIHGFEGSWGANTGNGYYGGLQMDLAFQRNYGSFLLRTKGTADNWTPLEQMWVAERAFGSGQGFSPWPNTARACGLI